jgi:hypothetical protein
MMALINLVATTANSQLVLFARRALHATNSAIGFLYAADAAVIGGLTAAFAFAFRPVAHGDRYLAEAAGRRAGSAGAGHPPGSRAAEREGAGHGPGSPGTGPAGRSAGAGQGTDGSKEAR